MARNESSPKKLVIKPFTPEEAEVVTRAYKESNLKKPDFWTDAILKGCAQINRNGGTK